MSVKYNVLLLALIALAFGCGNGSDLNFVGSEDVRFEKITGIKCPKNAEVVWFQVSRIRETHNFHLIAKIHVSREYLTDLIDSLFLERVDSSGGYVSTQVLYDAQKYAQFWDPPDLVTQSKLDHRYILSRDLLKKTEWDYRASLVWSEDVAYLSLFGPKGGFGN